MQLYTFTIKVTVDEETLVNAYTRIANGMIAAQLTSEWMVEGVRDENGENVPRCELLGAMAKHYSKNTPETC